MYEFLGKVITAGVCKNLDCCIYSENLQSHEILSAETNWEFNRDVKDQNGEWFQLYFKTSNELHLWYKVVSGTETFMTDYTLTLGNGVTE